MIIFRNFKGNNQCINNSKIIERAPWISERRIYGVNLDLNLVQKWFFTTFSSWVSSNLRKLMIMHLTNIIILCSSVQNMYFQWDIVFHSNIEIINNSRVLWRYNIMKNRRRYIRLAFPKDWCLAGLIYGSHNRVCSFHQKAIAGDSFQSLQTYLFMRSIGEHFIR